MKKNKNCHYFSETFEAEVRHKTDLLDFVFIKFSNSQIKCFFSTFVFALTTHFNNHQDWAKQSNKMINSKCRSENKKLSFRFTAFFCVCFSHSAQNLAYLIKETQHSLCVIHTPGHVQVSFLLDSPLSLNQKIAKQNTKYCYEKIKIQKYFGICKQKTHY